MKSFSVFWYRMPLFCIFLMAASAELHAQNPIEKLPSLSILINKSKFVDPATNHSLPKKFATSQGFICRWEDNIEKSANLPLRFRLGCVEAVDRMEGKRRDWLHP